MADVHVSTFADLLTAISVTSNEIYIDADLDAQAEGIDSVSSFQIRCNIHGNGHTISNLMVLGGVSIGIYGSSNLTVADVYFKNFGAKYAGNTVGVSSSGYYYYYFKNCKFSQFLSCGNNGGFLSAQGSSTRLYFTNCAFDTTFARATTFGASGYFEQCNIVVREGQFTSGQISLSNNTYTDWVFYQCNIAGNVSLGGSYSYVALKDCTSSASSITASGPANCLFCDASGIAHTVSGIQEVTEGQLQDQSYLQSIGFLP